MWGRGRPGALVRCLCVHCTLRATQQGRPRQSSPKTESGSLHRAPCGPWRSKERPRVPTSWATPQELLAAEISRRDGQGHACHASLSSWRWLPALLTASRKSSNNHLDVCSARHSPGPRQREASSQIWPMNNSPHFKTSNLKTKIKRMRIA